MAMPAAMTVPAATPANLGRLEVIDLGLRHQRGHHGFHLRRRELRRIDRRQRRGVGNADKRRSARGHSDREFQDLAKFHRNSPYTWFKSVT